MEVACLNLVLVRMWKKDIIREVTTRKVTAHLCLKLIVKELKISVEQDMVVTTLNITKHYSSVVIMDEPIEFEK